MKTIFALMLVAASASAQFNFTDLALTPNEVAGAPPCTTYVVGNVPAFSAFEDTGAGASDYYESSYYYRWAIYAYRTVGGTKIYSTGGFEASFTDDDGGNSFFIQLNWTAVSLAEGYRIVVMDDPWQGLTENSNYYVDITGGGTTSATIGKNNPSGGFDWVNAGSPTYALNSQHGGAVVVVTPKSVCQ